LKIIGANENLEGRLQLRQLHLNVSVKVRCVVDGQTSLGVCLSDRIGIGLQHCLHDLQCYESEKERNGTEQNRV